MRGQHNRQMESQTDCRELGQGAWLVHKHTTQGTPPSHPSRPAHLVVDLVAEQEGLEVLVMGLGLVLGDGRAPAGGTDRLAQLPVCLPAGVLASGSTAL